MGAGLENGDRNFELSSGVQSYPMSTRLAIKPFDSGADIVIENLIKSILRVAHATPSIINANHSTFSLTTNREQNKNMFRAQQVRDPLHNLIEFGANQFEDAMWRVVQTSAFQRLRRVKQLGLSELVYPGATHSRFAHSLGVFQTARMLMKIVERHLGQTRWKPHQAEHALAAALVHDVGHGPFSHAFEAVGKRMNLPLADHERISDRLIREGEISQVLDAQLGSGFASNVADVIKQGPGSIYSAVVSSQFDADRLDYMRRDRLMTGTQHGAIDFDWLIANLEVGNVPFGVDDKMVGEVETFVLGPKALYAAETYVLGLFQLYPTVYFHKATRGAEKILGELLFQVMRLASNGDWKKTGLPNKHPLLTFAKSPHSLDQILALDDTVLWGALSFLTGASDDTIKCLAKRLRDRQLYKCIDVRELLRTKLGEDGEEDVVEQACQRVDAKIVEWLSSKTDVAPRIMTDKTEREPYKRFQESKGPLNQIRIKTSSGELVDLFKRSKVVAAISTFKLYRVYVSDDDARLFVEQTIIAEGNNGGVS